VDVCVRVPTALRELGDGRSTLALDLREDATIVDLLDAIGTAHPALERRIRDEQGMVRTHVNIFVGDENVRAIDGAGTVLRAGDEVSIVAAVSGG
jgi:molybdopterin synthase sulfur carrier subunit